MPLAIPLRGKVTRDRRIRAAEGGHGKQQPGDDDGQCSCTAEAPMTTSIVRSRCVHAGAFFLTTNDAETVHLDAPTRSCRRLEDASERLLSRNTDIPSPSSPPRALANEAVAEAELGRDAAVVGVDLAPQVRNVALQSHPIVLVRRPTHLQQQSAVRHEMAPALDEHAQQLELDWSQVNFQVVQANGVCGEIYFEP